jgi:glycosyltransferase involved in cell wall biosynthesis
VVHAGEEAAFVAMLFRWLYGIPYVYDMDSSIAQQMVEQMPFLRPLAGLFNWFEARALKNAAAAAPVCNALADLAWSRGATHVFTLHDISQLEQADFRSDGALRERLGIDGLILMYVGNLQAYQGIDLLLEAFARVLAGGADMDLVIAGGSDEQIEGYRATARSLGCDERTHFIGQWPASGLGALLAEADILTAPRTKGINTPMKVFPYLHSGLPVLVTDLPTHTQILDDSVAMLAPPEPEGFAEAIVRLARDAELRQRLGEAGRAFVERNHTFDAHVRRVHQLYDFLEEDLRTDSAEDLRTDSAPRSPRALPPHEEAS